MYIFPDKHFILASGSPRRKELMAMLNVNFDVNTSIKVDESIPDGVVSRAEDIPVYL